MFGTHHRDESGNRKTAKLFLWATASANWR